MYLGNLHRSKFLISCSKYLGYLLFMSKIKGLKETKTLKVAPKYKI